MSFASNIQEDLLPEQILQAAMQLYQKHGLKKVTMDDVSKVIGKSRSSIYYYYKSKDEIFEAVLEALIGDVINEIGTAVSKVSTLKEKIRTFCLTKIKTSEEKKAFFTAIEAGMDIHEISAHTAMISSIHKRMMNEESAFLRKMLITEAKNNGMLPRKPKEYEALIFVLLSSVRGIRREILQENNRHMLNASVDTLTSMVVGWLNQ